MKAKSAGYRKAIAHLRKVDPVMDEVISKVGPFNLTLRTAGTHFDALIRSIVYQQLSGKAAATIRGRVLLLFIPDAQAADPASSPGDCGKGGPAPLDWGVVHVARSRAASEYVQRGPTA